jgi:hypothetical protein
MAGIFEEEDKTWRGDDEREEMNEYKNENQRQYNFIKL